MRVTSCFARTIGKLFDSKRGVADGSVSKKSLRLRVELLLSSHTHTLTHSHTLSSFFPLSKPQPLLTRPACLSRPHCLPLPFSLTTSAFRRSTMLADLRVHMLLLASMLAVVMAAVPSYQLYERDLQRKASQSRELRPRQSTTPPTTNVLVGVTGPYTECPRPSGGRTYSSQTILHIAGEVSAVLVCTTTSNAALNPSSIQCAYSVDDGTIVGQFTSPGAQYCHSACVQLSSKLTSAQAWTSVLTHDDVSTRLDSVPQAPTSCASTCESNLNIESTRLTSAEFLCVVGTSGQYSCSFNLAGTPMQGSDPACINTSAQAGSCIQDA